MRALWEGNRSELGSAGTQKLHLIAGLAKLLTEWSDAARSERRHADAPLGTSTSELTALAALAAAQRQLGVAADLDRLIAWLDGQGALLGDRPSLAAKADQLRLQVLSRTPRR